MSNKKISELPIASEFTGEESFVMVQNGITKSITGGKIIKPIDITKSELLNLISINGLIIGAIYSITDAGDTLGGTITVNAVTNNTIDGNGSWTFDAKLGSAVRFALMGTAGSVNQLTYTRTLGGAITLLSAPIPFNISANQTALDVVAAVNAGTDTHNVRAVAFTHSTIDRPQIVLQELEGAGTGASSSLVVATTTLTIGNQQTVDRGFTTETVILNSVYDILQDQITYAYDSKYVNLVSCSVGRRSALGYNPIQNFRWNDPRYLNCRFIETGWKDIFCNAAPSAVSKDVSLTSCTFENLILVTSGITNVRSLSSSITASNILNINLSSSTVRFNVSEVFCNALSLQSNTGEGTFTLSNLSTGGISTANNISASNNRIDSAASLQISNLSVTGNGLTGAFYGFTYNNLASGAPVYIDSLTNVIGFGLGGNNFEPGAKMSIYNIDASSQQVLVTNNTIKHSVTTGDDVRLSGLSGGGVFLRYSKVDYLRIFDSTIVEVNIELVLLRYLELSLLTGVQIDIQDSDWGIVNLSPLLTYLQAYNATIKGSTLDSPIIAINPVLDTNYTTILFSNISTAEAIRIDDSYLEDVVVTTDGTNKYREIYFKDNCRIISSTFSPYIGMGVDLIYPTFSKCEFYRCSDVQLLDAQDLTHTVKLTNVVVKNCPMFYFGTLNALIPIDATLDNSEFLNSNVDLLSQNNITASNILMYDSTYDWGGGAGLYYHGSLITDKVILENFILNIQTAINTDDVYSNLSLKNGSFNVTDVNVTIVKNLTINGPNFTFKTDVINYASSPSPVEVTYIPGNFVSKKTTIYSNQTLNGVANTQLGYSGNVGAYLNLTSAAINGAAIQETAVGVGPFPISGKSVIMTHNNTVGQLQAVVEGILIDQ